MAGAGIHPFLNFNFIVEIDNIESAGFSEVSGIVAQTDIIEYRNGNSLGSSVKMPGRTHFGNVTLHRGITLSNDLWNWHKTVTDGEVQRRNVAIILLDAKHQAVRRWILFEAWPCKYQTAPLIAKGNEVAIETLEIVCERIELA